MADKELQKIIRERRRRLQEIRHRALTLPAEGAMSLILDAKNPVEVVHSFPEEDFYFLVKDIGPEDALPILALASAKQLEYLLDMDLWKQDRVDNHAAVKWIGLLTKADPRRMIRWFADDKTDFLEFFLFKNVEVKIREQDQNASDFGNDYVTLDDIFYFRCREYAPQAQMDRNTIDGREENEMLKEREQIITQLMGQLSDFDHVLYQKILLESAALIAAEAEEELYRLRNVRLAEKGFLPFEESIGVYQPLQPQEIHRIGRKRLAPTEDIDTLQPVPFFPDQMMETESAFTRALKTIKEESVVMQLQSEFAGLCNQLMVADRKGEMTRESLREIVQKACGYISIGLDNLSGSRSDLVGEFPLSDLFRVGYGLALKLKWKARKWRDSSWFADQGLPLSFWGEEWLGVVGGLLLKKPLFFDNYETGVLYRDFTATKDIRNTASALEEIMAFDHLLSLLPIKVEPLRAHTLLTSKNLILTLWARAHMRLDTHRPVFSPISLDDFRAFFSDLWNPGKPPRTVKRSMKNSFLVWLSRVSNLSGTEITDRLGNTFEKLFWEIESEYGRVTDRALDPRFMPHFLIKDMGDIDFGT